MSEIAGLSAVKDRRYSGTNDLRSSVQFAAKLSRGSHA
jgi:hypothetical protein